MYGVLFSQGSGDPEEGTSKKEGLDLRTERSLEQSRKLILEWADELHHVDKVGTRLRAWVMREYWGA